MNRTESELVKTLKKRIRPEYINPNDWVTVSTDDCKNEDSGIL